MQWWMLGHMSDMFVNLPGAQPEVAAAMQGMLTAMRVFGTLMALAFCVLFGWLMARLCRADVRAEFGIARLVTSTNDMSAP
jgi:hypothetical protein